MIISWNCEAIYGIRQILHKLIQPVLSIDPISRGKTLCLDETKIRVFAKSVWRQASVFGSSRHLEVELLVNLDDLDSLDLLLVAHLFRPHIAR